MKEYTHNFSCSVTVKKLEVKYLFHLWFSYIQAYCFSECRVDNNEKPQANHPTFERSTKMYRLTVIIT